MTQKETIISAMTQDVTRSWTALDLHKEVAMTQKGTITPLGVTLSALSALEADRSIEGHWKKNNRGSAQSRQRFYRLADKELF